MAKGTALKRAKEATLPDKKPKGKHPVLPLLNGPYSCHLREHIPAGKTEVVRMKISEPHSTTAGGETTETRVPYNIRVDQHKDGSFEAQPLDHKDSPIELDPSMLMLTLERVFVTEQQQFMCQMMMDPSIWDASDDYWESEIKVHPSEAKRDRVRFNTAMYLGDLDAAWSVAKELAQKILAKDKKEIPSEGYWEMNELTEEVQRPAAKHLAGRWIGAAIRGDCYIVRDRRAAPTLAILEHHFGLRSLQAHDLRGMGQDERLHGCHESPGQCNPHEVATQVARDESPETATPSTSSEDESFGPSILPPHPSAFYVVLQVPKKPGAVQHKSSSGTMAPKASKKKKNNKKKKKIKKVKPVNEEDRSGNTTENEDDAGLHGNNETPDFTVSSAGPLALSPRGAFELSNSSASKSKDSVGVPDEDAFYNKEQMEQRLQRTREKIAEARAPPREQLAKGISQLESLVRAYEERQEAGTLLDGPDPPNFPYCPPDTEPKPTSNADPEPKNVIDKEGIDRNHTYLGGEATNHLRSANALRQNIFVVNSGSSDDPAPSQATAIDRSSAGTTNRTVSAKTRYVPFFENGVQVGLKLVSEPVTVTKNGMVESDDGASACENNEWETLRFAWLGLDETREELKALAEIYGWDIVNKAKIVFCDPNATKPPLDPA